jgi:hypothetical protein
MAEMKNSAKTLNTAHSLKTPYFKVSLDDYRISKHLEVRVIRLINIWNRWHPK